MTEPAHLENDRTALLGFLQRQRDLVEWKVRETSDETLASVRMPERPLPAWHRPAPGERGAIWFRGSFAGETGMRFDSIEEDPDGDFHAEGVPMGGPPRRLRGRRRRDATR